MNYKKLFTPFKIGSMEIKNRIVMSPMGTNASHSDGSITQNRIDYYAARAKGGVGMIIFGCQFVSKEFTSGSIEGVLEENYVLPRLASLCEAVHRYDTKICAQLSCGVGRNAFPDRFKKPVSASAIPSALDPSVICHALTLEEIKNITNLFTNSARLAVNAGFDAIEIHAHAGYLIDQFMSPLWNKREDEYGGTLENRMRFACEIIRAVRKGIPNDVPILFRISLDHRFEGGRTIADSMEIIKILEKEGVDALDVDVGSYETIDYIFPPAYLGDACLSYVCKPARKAVSIPILNSGNHTPETALRLIESGDADFVMFGRQLIADPELPNKLMNGCREDVRPCIRCNEDCVGRTVVKRIQLSCSVNIQVLEEKRMSIEKTTSPKKIMIIGAGPAGLEAARVAALKGHKVTLFEKENVMGGQLAAAATAGFKKPLKDLIAWYKTQLNKLGVEIRFNTEITADAPELESYDKIFVAIGAVPVVPDIKGIDGANVVGIIDAHKHKELVKGNNIVICGGGLSGCDYAIELASELGKKVTIIEMDEKIARGAIFINAKSLLNSLERNNIEVLTKCKVISIEKEGIQIQRADGKNDYIKADTVITAFGMRRNLPLVEQIKEKYYCKTRVIGDCEKIGRVGTAIRMGFYAASSLD
jgi:2-enoate reductase